MMKVAGNNSAAQIAGLRHRMLDAWQGQIENRVRPVNDQRELLRLDRAERRHTSQPSVNPVPIRPNYTLPLNLEFLRLELHPVEQSAPTNFSEIPELEPATNFLMSHGYSQGVQQLTYLAALAAQATGNPFKARAEIERASEPYEKVLAI